jgi:hypothetical protein
VDKPSILPPAHVTCNHVISTRKLIDCNVNMHAMSLPKAESLINLLAHRIHSAIMHYRHGADITEDILREGVAAELVRSFQRRLLVLLMVTSNSR